MIDLGDTMFNEIPLSKKRDENYDKLLEMVPFYINKADPLVSNLANLSALLNYFLDNINWIGFYLSDGKDALYLGPFQGHPACTSIRVGRGVCGMSAKLKKTVIVADVRDFEGHIFCDPNSRSEMVVPIVKEGRLIGVLDVDAPQVNRFSNKDQEVLEKVVKALVDIL